MPERKAAISIQNLVKYFGKKKVLDGITLDVYQGETFVIMGGSGCGKSTLLRHMTGAIQPSSGKVYVGDKELTLLN